MQNKDNVRSSATGRQLKQKPSSTSMLLISSGLTCGPSTTSFLLISPGPAKAFNFFVRVHLTSLLPFRLDSAFLTNRCMVSQLPTWWQSIQTGAWSVGYVPGGSPYKQVPGQSVMYLVAVHTNRFQVSQLYTWWQSIQTGAWSVGYVPGGSPYKQVPGQSVINLVAVHTNRCQVSQLYTWWQSIQTAARSVSYVPGGSLYKQVPGQSVTYPVAVHTDFCQVGQSPGLLQSPAGWLACLRHAVWHRCFCTIKDNISPCHMCNGAYDKVLTLFGLVHNSTFLSQNV